MAWRGSKRVAFLPVHRIGAVPPDDPVPADWTSDILRRVLADPSGPSQTNRSLRAFINVVSSGRADLVPVVLPMRTLEIQDIGLGHFEGELGGSLRDQGFAAAMIVTLGGQQTGTAELAGFWARVAMVESVGIWAMELIHVLGPIFDSYPFGGNMGLYDVLAGSVATHPCAFTKLLAGWADAESVHRLATPSRTFDLHSVSLQQPPPPGRVAAVRVGDTVPYLMVEARTMTDQFDSQIPAPGVIAYMVQTTSEMGLPEQGQMPVRMLTLDAGGSPKPLDVGQSFTADSGVRVEVLATIAGGYRAVILDPASHVVNLTIRYGSARVDSAPTGAAFPGLGVTNFCYRRNDDHLFELWRATNGDTGTSDLTALAGASRARGRPFLYADSTRNTAILVYRSADSKVRALYWSTGAVGVDDLSGSAGAPSPAGDPTAYYDVGRDGHHVIYLTSNKHLHELRWSGVAPVQYGGDLTATAGAPECVGRPSGFAGSAGIQVVVYRDSAGIVRDLYWTTGAASDEELSVTAGAAKAISDPVAFYTSHDDVSQVYYAATGGHVWQLAWVGNAPVQGRDLSAECGAPPATGNVTAYHHAPNDTRHVVYRRSDGHLHEIVVDGAGPPIHRDLTLAFGAPLAVEDPAAVSMASAGTQHVVFRAGDGHLYEILW